MKRMIFAIALIAAVLFLAQADVSAVDKTAADDVAVTAAEKAKEDPPPVRNIDVKDEAAISDAESVHKSLTFVTDLVMKCTKEVEPPQQCQCKFQEEMGSIRTSYDDAIAKHPDWKDKVVNFRKDGSETTSISFPGVAERLEACK